MKIFMFELIEGVVGKWGILTRYGVLLFCRYDIYKVYFPTAPNLVQKECVETKGKSETAKLLGQAINRTKQYSVSRQKFKMVASEHLQQLMDIMSFRDTIEDLNLLISK